MSQEKEGALVGIDLGTTFSLAATLQDGEPVVISNALGELLTPSAVAIDDGGATLVGAPARARASTHPNSTALWFKRDMGTMHKRTLGDVTLRPEELSALVLREIKTTVERELGMPIREAVVTVPAYFGDLQRRATRDACQLAELPVERIINEPTAAALAYGLHEREREMRAVVLDLGGGTFDVTVLEIIEGVIEIQSSAGDARLGGEDFADGLASYVAKRLAKEQNVEVVANTPAWARLREACERAKRRLTDAEQARVALPDLPTPKGSTVSVELELTRSEAEESWKELVRRLEKPIHRALRDADIRPTDIDEVILVGGATRMPCVTAMVSQLFGRLPLRKLPPDEAVAMGAAVQAALKDGDEAVEDMVVTDVAPFTLGIATSGKVGGRIVDGLFSPILERGTVLPASRVEEFSTLVNGQTKIEVEVFQGEHSLCKDNQQLGSYTVRGIPSAPAGEQSIEVRFTYDLNGILEVDTRVQSTNRSSTLVIEKSPGAMSKAEIKKALKAISGLKLHPRDALPNVTALSRAEALYVELTGGERAQLGESMNAFRIALDGQDKAEIEQLRQHLTALTAALQREL